MTIMHWQGGEVIQQDTVLPLGLVLCHTEWSEETIAEAKTISARFTWQADETSRENDYV